MASPTASMRLLADNPQPSSTSPHLAPLLDTASPAVHYDHSFVSLPSTASSSASFPSSLFASAFGAGVGHRTRGVGGVGGVGGVVDGAGYRHLPGLALPQSSFPSSQLGSLIDNGGNARTSDEANAAAIIAPSSVSSSSLVASFPPASATVVSATSLPTTSLLTTTKKNSTAIMEETKEPQLVSSDSLTKTKMREPQARGEDEGKKEGKPANGEISQFTEVPLTGEYNVEMRKRIYKIVSVG